jgi:glycosyltransferase involved in cell wall biosynthesis
MPILSIITINFNNAEGLEKTINSVVSQSFQDFEYIVIDGGSDDNSVNIIKQQSKINQWVSEKDGGIYDAMNKGILKASGQYLLFLNSGDYLNENVLDVVFKEKQTKDIIYGNMKINWGGSKVTDGFMPRQITIEHMVKDTLWHPVSFIKKELFNKFGLYNTTYEIVSDYDFFFKTIIINKVSTLHVNEFISEYNVEGLSSLPANKVNEKTERLHVLKSYLSEEEMSGIQYMLDNNKDSVVKRLFIYVKNKLF